MQILADLLRFNFNPFDLYRLKNLLNLLKSLLNLREIFLNFFYLLDLLNLREKILLSQIWQI
ncbi:hypothetical protein HYN56_20320 [Flavobacterium crocinum]|uniref:Uncharacterized protein n=1 Tax=Flavobacterium crocinum TaxID=2183896 RepID=A0A2S1YQQ9_9FLAO|nr:hypothetical protein HYN56_20320 [Flavobacterium crocinum]